MAQDSDRLGSTFEALDSLHPRERVPDRLRRLRFAALPILQSAVAAGLAWLIAAEWVGHEQPFFAPIAALISVGVSLGQRLSRVVELVVGVALGVLLGDTIAGLIGSGLWQMVLVVVLAMTAAVFLGGGALIVTQAGASAVLMVTLVPLDPRIVSVDRFVDASVGGMVGIVISAVLLPINPVSVAKRHVDPVLDTLADLIDQCSRALTKRDKLTAARALSGASSTQEDVDELNQTLEGSAEIARLAPVRWRSRGQLVGYLDASDPIGHMARNVQVLARHVVAVLRRGEPIPAAMPESLRALSGAIRLLRLSLDHDDLPQEAQASALAAAEMATEALTAELGFDGQIVVAQVRSLTVDVLYATGVSRDDVFTLLPDLPDGTPA